MNTVPALLFLLLLASSYVAGIHIYRMRQYSSLPAKAPLLIESALAILVIGLAFLPEALPRLFERVLGHSISSAYVYPMTSDGTQITETWILARWWTPFATCLLVLSPSEFYGRFGTSFDEGTLN